MPWMRGCYKDKEAHLSQVPFSDSSSPWWFGVLTLHIPSLAIDSRTHRRCIPSISRIRKYYSFPQRKYPVDQNPVQWLVHIDHSMAHAASSARPDAEPRLEAGKAIDH